MQTKLSLALLSLLSVAVAAFQYRISVHAMQGDIYVTLPDGSRRQITFTGKDYDPSVSPDGKSIVFARERDGPAIPLASQPRPQKVVRSELWIIGVDRRNPRLLFSGEVKDKQFRYVNFFKPQLSLDDRWVYFLIPYTAVTDAVVRLDRRASEAKVLTPAEQFSVLGGGRYKGFLVVQKRVQEDEGATLQFWLMSPDGEPIRKIADSEAAVKKFVEQTRRGVS